MAAWREEPSKLRRERDAWATVVDTLLWRGIRAGTAVWDRETLRNAEDKLRVAEHRLAIATDAKDEAA